MKLFLIGLPGSGKSTLGKELSRKLNYTLIDTDAVFVKNEGKSIEDIFSEKGESYFRKAESAALKEVIKADRVIISTGGGTPCFFDNMDLINQRGISIFLNIPLDDIAKRLFNSPHQNRPLIQGKNLGQIRQFLEEKLKERLPYYSKAKLEFTDSSLDADKIIAEMKKQGVLNV
jgi:shikimate kinase